MDFVRFHRTIILSGVHSVALKQLQYTVDTFVDNNFKRMPPPHRMRSLQKIDEDHPLVTLPEGEAAADKLGAPSKQTLNAVEDEI